jgi:hypothetical protein
LYKIGIWDLARYDFVGNVSLLNWFFSLIDFNTEHLFFTWFSAIAAGLFLGWYRLHYQQCQPAMTYANYLTTHNLPFNLFFPVERRRYGCRICIRNNGYIVSEATSPTLVGHLKQQGRNWLLTNYLVQTIICTVFFYGLWNGCTNGRMTLFQLFFFVAEVIHGTGVLPVLFGDVSFQLLALSEWLLSSG